MVWGTRPEAIKLAPVAHALRAAGLNLRILHSGQHPLTDAQATAFCDAPIVSLGLASDGDPFAYVGRLASALRRRDEPRPALVMVQGDTASAYGGARAAVLGALPLAHVEAGLRSHDRRNPWPEEDFRIAIDRASTLLFAPTQHAAAQLREERVRGKVHVTGNSGIDALRMTLDNLPPAPPRNGRPTILVTCHRREHWGAPLDGVIAAVARLAHAGHRLEVVMHPNPHIAARWQSALGTADNVALLDPLPYTAMLVKMRDAALILSDSGGMQEEAPYLGTPLFILREATERPEGIATGQLRLVGTDTDRIVAEVAHFFGNPWMADQMRRPAQPFGDGHAAPRIAAIVKDWLASRGERADNDARPASAPQLFSSPSGMLFR